MNTNKREEEKNFVDNVKVQNNNYKIYEKKVAELKETYLYLMDDYNKYHVMSINSPSNVEYKQSYANIKMNIQNLFSSLFYIYNKLDDENNVVLDNIDKVDDLIAEEKQMSLELEGTINDMVINERSSTTLKSDYTKINYQEFYILLSLVFSIIMVVIIGFIINGYYRNTI
jgi:hypothetical protein